MIMCLNWISAIRELTLLKVLLSKMHFQDALFALQDAASKLEESSLGANVYAHIGVIS